MGHCGKTPVRVQRRFIFPEVQRGPLGKLSKALWLSQEQCGASYLCVDHFTFQPSPDDEGPADFRMQIVRCWSKRAHWLQPVQMSAAASAETETIAATQTAASTIRSRIRRLFRSVTGEAWDMSFGGLAAIARLSWTLSSSSNACKAQQARRRAYAICYLSGTAQVDHPTSGFGKQRR